MTYVARVLLPTVVADARNGVKLWYRNDADLGQRIPDARYEDVLAGVGHLLYPELTEALERPVENLCSQCIRSVFYGATATKEFGGVDLCDECREMWRSYVRSAWEWCAQVLPIN